MIRGKLVSLRAARLDERKLIYDMGLSTDSMNGCFYDIGGYAAFTADYGDIYYEGKAPSVCGGFVVLCGDTPVGFISYSSADGGTTYLKNGCREIDIWLYGEANCGKGYGTDAIKTLTDWLNENHGIHTFFMCPEKKNLRAVRAYGKAGFRVIGDADKRGYIERIYDAEYLAQGEIEEISDNHEFMVKEYGQSGV
jgi:diamine N-acetyltransferase